LLFSSTPVFENGSFSVIADSLEKKHHFIIGRAVARSIIFGHPGPSRLNDYIVEYILQGKEPKSSDLAIEQLSHRMENRHCFS
jgi:hypothetical protein